MGNHRDRGGRMVQYGVGDRPDVGAEHRAGTTTAHNHKGGIAKGLDQVVGRLPDRESSVTFTVAKFCRQGRSTSVTAAASSSKSRALATRSAARPQAM